MKKCKTCGTEKDESEFYRDNRCKSAIKYRGSCKDCMNIKSAAWAKKNPAKVSKYQSAWLSKNPDYKNEYYKNIISEDAALMEKRRINRAAHHRNFPEKQREYNKNYPIEKKREAYRKYRKTHPEQVKAYNHNRRARIVANGGTFTGEEWNNLCELYENRCLKCGSREKLTPDHVVPLSAGGSNSIENIQPLCLPCNLSKGKKYYDYRIG